MLNEFDLRRAVGGRGSLTLVLSRVGVLEGPDKAVEAIPGTRGVQVLQGFGGFIQGLLQVQYIRPPLKKSLFPV